MPGPFSIFLTCLMLVFRIAVRNRRGILNENVVALHIEEGVFCEVRGPGVAVVIEVNKIGLKLILANAL